MLTLWLAYDNKRKICKAIHALDNGDIWEAYELYLAAELYTVAHDLAVLELAPEAVIRQDFVLLNKIFAKISKRSVEGWHNRGKVCHHSLILRLSDTIWSGVLGLCRYYDPSPRIAAKAERTRYDAQRSTSIRIRRTHSTYPQAHCDST
jgi:hypothetical protein